MKILMTSASGAMQFYRRGVANALVACGHHVVMWSEQEKCAFDVFAAFEPNIFWGSTYGLSSAQYKCIKNRPELIAILEGSQWGSASEYIDLNEYPILVPTNNEIKLVGQLKTEHDKLFISKYYHENQLERTMDFWGKITKVLSISLGADVLTYGNGEIRDELKCDIGFIGGWWGYKSRELDKYLTPICHPVGKYNIKLFGSGFPLGQFLGSANENTAKNLFASAKILPNISEPHHFLGFEVNERIFKTSLGNGLVINCGVGGSYKADFFGEELVNCDTPQDFFDMVEFALKNPSFINKKNRELKKVVMEKYTYFDVVAKLFGELGLKDEQSKVVQKKKVLYGL